MGVMEWEALGKSECLISVLSFWSYSKGFLVSLKA